MIQRFEDVQQDLKEFYIEERLTFDRQLDAEATYAECDGVFNATIDACISSVNARLLGEVIIVISTYESFKDSEGESGGANTGKQGPHQYMTWGTTVTNVGPLESSSEVNLHLLDYCICKRLFK